MEAFIPKNKEELFDSLGKMKKTSKIISGGTDLVIFQNIGKVRPTELLVMTNLEDCKKIYEDDTHIYIGASCTMDEISSNVIVKKHLGALVDAASDVGSAQIRTQATIGGNLGQASPAQDLYPSLYMYDTTVVIATKEKKFRNVSIKDFIKGIGQTDLNFNEAVYEVKIKKPNYVSHFTKLGSRVKLTISRIGLAVGLELDNETIKKAHVCVGAISIVPLLVEEAEKALIGKELNEDTMDLLAKHLSDLILKVTPKEFDRDYKMRASKGISHDTIQKFL